MNNKISYVRCGDYYIPNLTVPITVYEIGKYGRLHRTFLKKIILAYIL